MRCVPVLAVLVMMGCSAPKLSWQDAPPPAAAVRDSVASNIRSDADGKLEWQVTPATEWISIQPAQGSAHIVASPPPGSSGKHALQFQARRPSGSWSSPVTWELNVTPRQLEPVAKTLGDENCDHNADDGQMDQSFTGTRIFAIDLGQSLDVQDITGAEIRVDTGNLNNSDAECRDGHTAFCPDYFRVDGTGAQWSPTVALTQCGRLDPGEARGFSAEQSADRPVLQKIATNSLRIVVAPSTGDDCIVNQIVVVIRLVER
jgi:hypothetical protein